MAERPSLPVQSDASHARIYAIVRSIPAGRVMTYGSVAAAAGLPRRARLVGQLLRRLPQGSTVPWQRVVNAQGRISPRGETPENVLEQRLRLQLEGVRFDSRAAIDLEVYGWTPPARR